MSTSFSATWHIVIVNVELAILIPVYFVILVAIGVNRKKETTFQSHYYTLVISQGIADFATILIFAPVTFARTYNVGNVIIYQLGDYGAARLLVTGAPYLLITRGIGVALITAQRFLTLCRSHSWLESKIIGLPSVSVVAVHWSLSFLIYSPGIVCSGESFFESEQTLFIVSSEAFNKYNPQIPAFRQEEDLIDIKSRMTQSNEYRLCLHIFLLTVVGIFIFFYWLAELLFGAETERSILREIRFRYPLISGNYSFINPVVLLILNRDIQRLLGSTMRRKPRVTVSASGQLGNGNGNKTPAVAENPNTADSKNNDH